MIDLAYTLNVRKFFFSSRSFVVAKNENVKKELNHENMIFHKSQRLQANEVEFVFTNKKSSPAQSHAL